MINNIEELKSLSAEDFYNLINSDENNEIKDWLAKLGNDRINEFFDPSLGIERTISYYRAMGYSEKWIKNKLMEIIETSNNYIKNE